MNRQQSLKSVATAYINKMKIFYLILILTAFSTISGNIVLRLCGQALNEVLSVVCNGKLNNLPVKKSGRLL